jgi:UDP-perosamine 4-acetyltransferase
LADAHDVVIVGGGGHASVLFDALHLAPSVNIIGYLAPEQSLLSSMGVRWLGDDSQRSVLSAKGIRGAVLGVAGVKSNTKRAALFAEWTAAGFTFVDVRHPRSTVASRAECGVGLQIMAGAVVNTGARLGTNVIVNTNATVEHDCEIGDHAHIAPGATLCGGVVVGEGALVGAGAVAVPGIRIGRFALVGAGSSVVRNVGDGSTMTGRVGTSVGSEREHRG